METARPRLKQGYRKFATSTIDIVRYHRDDLGEKNEDEISLKIVNKQFCTSAGAAGHLGSSGWRLQKAISTTSPFFKGDSL